MVGSLIVRDLAGSGISVKAVDLSEQNLAALSGTPGVSCQRKNLADPADVTSAVDDADAVVGAVPGRLGFQMLRTVIEAGKPISDISFSPEDPLQLHELAKQRGVTAVVDCGVSPGLSNLAIGRAASLLDEIEDVTILVGGLPVARHWPYEYRSVFSPTDVIEEYTRPARLLEHGAIVVKPALSEVEPVDFTGVGTLEAFNSDGLRTLLHTVGARNMKEKTLRYPGHADRMRMLRETGFFSSTPLTVGNVQISPREITETLLFNSWRRAPDEEEITILRVTVTGRSRSGTEGYRYDLVDRTDRDTGATSMARTTGFPCAIVARLLADGTWSAPGVQPPERFGGDATVYQRLVEELAARGVHFRESSLSA